MKQVKSKITGDIGELDFDSKEGIFIVIYYDLHTKATIKNYYKSLEDLYEGWEDYEEPDKFYYIDADCYIKSHSVDDRDFNNVKDGVENLIAIGNYFETEEEAEKAVKKLKAMERLRRKGFRFTGYNLMNGCITFTFDGYYYGDEEDRKTSISDDLDFAFRR